ncbi:unannotated protein [freshwater metagenome]|uniref:Unannotated protein n=1 Tax=freshwater metagenome TaxID=449393 RepID=A0A6J7C5T4_9ZZZZ
MPTLSLFSVFAQGYLRIRFIQMKNRVAPFNEVSYLLLSAAFIGGTTIFVYAICEVMRMSFVFSCE